MGSEIMILFNNRWWIPEPTLDPPFMILKFVNIMIAE